MTSSNGYSVYVGHWTDWSKGSIVGSQITVPASTSNIIIAAITTFIALLGGVTWTTVAYTVHQLRATKGQQHGLFHQHQALLRNITSPLSFLLTIIQTSFAWRHDPPPGRIRHTTLLVSLPLFIRVVFMIAGILLSLLATTGDVLVRSPNCKMWDLDIAASLSPTALSEYILALGVWEQQEYSQILSYAQGCYSHAGDPNKTQPKDLVSRCDFYTKPTLDWTTSYPTQCPFADGTCVGNDVIEFDTGFLDTNLDLGINDREEDRLQFRRVTTCAPINPQKYGTWGFVNSSWGEVAEYHLGLSLTLDYPYNWPDLASAAGSDVTFVYGKSSYLSRAMPYHLRTASSTGGESAYNGSGYQTFYPRQDIFGDTSRPISLFFLANRVSFFAPTTDPWFNATEPIAYESIVLGNITIFSASSPASVIGCVDNVELRNPSTGSSTNANEMLYTGIYGIFNISNSSVASDIQLNAHQQRLAEQVASSLVLSMMTSAVEVLGPRALVANDYLISTQRKFSSPLPSTQWHVEMQRFQSISMAVLQRHRFVLAVGPTDPELLKNFVEYPPELQWICSEMKIRSTAYFSYSVLGLGLIFGIGGFILLLSIILTFAVPAIQLRSGKGIHRRDQWHTSFVLFLQASLYNSVGRGTWTTDPVDEVPTALPGEAFSAYDESLEAPACLTTRLSGSTWGRGSCEAEASSESASSIFKPLTISETALEPLFPEAQEPTRG